MLSSIASSPATPLDYFGSHRDPLHSFGGYAPNFPPVATSLQRPQGNFPLSTTRRDYLPPILPPAAETCSSSGQVFLGRSGFSANKALHNPSYVDVLRARRAQAADFYSLKSKMSGDCTIPTSLATEHNERFNPNSLYYDNCGPPNYYLLSSPGSRESGFTSCYSSVNPVFWRQHDPLMDQLGKNPPDIRSNAASVSQTDYQPYDLVNYETTPIAGTVKVRGQGTGFRTNKELSKCFLPEPCVYSHHTPSYITPQFDTTYNTDYKHRALSCGVQGLEMLSSGTYRPKPLSNDASPEFSLGCGPPRDFLSETRESFPDYRPTFAQRTLGLANPISKVSSSGFVHTLKNHNRTTKPCADPPDVYDTTPQRYNPWPRFYLGHNTLIDKNYRPNPIRTGIDYTVTTSLPTTGADANVFLY